MMSRSEIALNNSGLFLFHGYMKSKICKCCNKELDISNFHKHKREIDGLRSLCKKCRSVVEKRDPEKRKICRNKPENKLKEKIYMNEYRKKNSEKLKQQSKISNKRNRFKNTEHKKRRYHEKLKNDPFYRMSHSMSGRLLNFLKSKKENKHWEEILGYTKKDLQDRMESLFKEGMTFENYGKNGWHIDHIIPLKYKLENGEYYWNQDELIDINSQTFKLAWGLNNLQPLWATENNSKCNRYIG